MFKPGRSEENHVNEVDHFTNLSLIKLDVMFYKIISLFSSSFCDNSVVNLTDA